jgi:hypothetical protein
MLTALPEIRPEDRTPLVEALLGMLRELQDRVGQLEQDNQHLRDEIARLKGLPLRPQLRPSLLEAPPKAVRPLGRPRPGSAKRPKTAELHIHHEQTLHPQDLPPGARLRGYEPYVVQELRLESENTRYLRARYDLPGGGSVLAPLPPGVVPVAGGHFGAHLVAFLLDQYHQAQVTEPLLLEQLWEYGIDISAGQLHRLLTENHDAFHQEKAEVLEAGLAVSSYLGVDDTRARHQGHNGYCTAITNDLFAYFESTERKNRLNFLQVLHGRQRHYAVNETAQAYWERQKLPESVRARLSQGPLAFACEETWAAHLAALAVTDDEHVRSATEGALLGGLMARGVSPELVVLSDGATAFVVLVHAACWVHAERPLAQLVPRDDNHRAALENIRGQIWALYQELKAYRAHPQEAARRRLEDSFDALVALRTDYPSINAVLRGMSHHRADLLRVLQRPEVPLHNNGCEGAIREYVKRRKVSGGTRSEAGRRCRDTFASLKKTCRKLGLCFWEYVQDRVRGCGQLPRLADLIRQRAQGVTVPSVAAVPA